MCLKARRAVRPRGHRASKRDAERFERYDQDVRKEYAWVPGFRYQEARAQVLRGFLDRPRLYHGEHAVALLEAPARINLAAALSRLAQ